MEVISDGYLFASIKNIKNVCRICLEESEGMTSISKNENSLQLSIGEMINISMKLKIERQDLLPHLVCVTCKEEIIQATKLQLKFARTQKILNEYIINLETTEIEKDQIIIINTIKEDRDNIIIENFQQTVIENVPLKISDDDQLSNRIKNYTEKKKYKCKKCGKMFNSQRDRTRHQRDSSHYTKKTITCPKCSIIMPSQNYKRHYAKHSMNFKCDICSKNFPNNFNLRRHVDTHTKPYACKLCNYKCTRQDKLEEHERGHTVDTVSCGSCGRHFQSQQDYNEHLDEDQNCIDEKYKRTLSCDVCMKTFALRSSLVTHKLLHTDESVICKNCGNLYANEKKLNEHILNVHKKTKSESKEFLCNICAKQYATKIALERHILTHMGVAKKYKCKICQKLFTQSGSLAFHSRIHTGEKPYVCHICSAAFNKPSNLNRHLNVHNG